MYKRLMQIADLPETQSFFLFGPRATGKSTLIRDYLQGSHAPHLTFDLLRSEDFLRLQAEPGRLHAEIMAQQKKNPQAVLQVHIDEVQKIPLLLDEVHSLIESSKGYIRFILSGSSARKLKRSGANLLGGRAWQKFLHPLTCTELGNDFVLEEALRFGTLPSTIGRSPAEKREDLLAYVATYLREEIQAEALTRRLDSFHRFLEVVAKNNGELVNLTAVAQEAMVKRATVANYFQILEDTLVGFFLPSWGHRLSRKDIVTHGKFYFFDTGVVNALQHGLETPLTNLHPLFGRFFEHWIILEFKRLHEYRGTDHRLGFFRTRGGAEVDLIQERGQKIHAIEIKSTKSVSLAQIRGLTSFGEEFPDAKLTVVCQAPRAYSLGKVMCLPWREFLDAESK